MVTRNKHDVIRERRLRQKLARVEEESRPQTTPKWFKYARCPICGERYVVNNNIHHKVNPLRMLGVAVCARCHYSRGTERLVKIYKLGKKLAAAGHFDEGHLLIHTEEIGDLIREAKELFS